MADNTTLNQGTGGDVVRTDDIAGVKYPVSKIALGADGTNDGFVCTALPLPVGDAGGSLTVDGTVAVTDGGGVISVDDAGTTLSVDDGAGSLTVDGTVTANAGTGTFTTKETRSATPSQSTVAGSASSVTVLASNANRLGATIANDSTSVLYLKLGATASSSSYSYKLYQDDVVEVPYGYTGVIDGIWVTATGNARVTELTA